MEELFVNFQTKVLKLEQNVLNQIDTEVKLRVNIRINAMAAAISKTYGIPVESLIQDMTEIETDFCKGIKKDKSRCLKQPRENGYCGFHQKQVPPPKPKVHERVPCPWEEET
jgi:hypothetical protein